MVISTILILPIHEHSLSFYWLVLSSIYFINIFFFNCFILFIGHTVCGILVPQPGIEPMLPPLGAQSLNHWTTRESLINIL